MLRRVMMADNSASPGADPYWSNVSALLHFDGADGSTTFTDQKGHVWTPAGNAQIDTAQSKFGGASGLFDGSGDYITAASHANFGFGTGDYTVEGWARPTGSGYRTIFDNRASGEGIAIYAGVAGRLTFTSNSAILAELGEVFSPTSFVHFAVTRQSGTVRGFLSGAQQWAITDERSLASSAAARIGSSHVAAQGYIGHLDEIRITKGVARYTSNFTPPAAPFPAG